jgi:hypothetical protein
MIDSSAAIVLPTQLVTGIVVLASIFLNAWQYCLVVAPIAMSTGSRNSKPAIFPCAYTVLTCIVYFAELEAEVHVHLQLGVALGFRHCQDHIIVRSMILHILHVE